MLHGSDPRASNYVSDPKDVLKNSPAGAQYANTLPKASQAANPSLKYTKPLF